MKISLQAADSSVVFLSCLAMSSLPQLCALPNSSTQNYSSLVVPRTLPPIELLKAPLVLMVAILSLSMIPITYRPGYHEVLGW